MGGIRVTKENTALVERQIHVLEGRLEKSLVKFNESLRVNRELRAEIDTLRRERSVFDGIYRRLERELQAKKREMAFLIEVANVAFEERDQSQTELAQLKVYAAKELQAFDETFRELDGLLEEDRKMKDAIRGRIAERTQPPPPGLSRTLGDTTRTTIEIDMSTKSRTVHLPTIKLAGATVAQGALQSASAGPAGATGRGSVPLKGGAPPDHRPKPAENKNFPLVSTKVGTYHADRTNQQKTPKHRFFKHTIRRPRCPLDA